MSDPEVKRVDTVHFGMIRRTKEKCKEYQTVKIRRGEPVIVDKNFIDKIMERIGGNR